MAFDDPYAPVPDPLFLTTPKPLNPNLSQQISEPKLSLKTHNKAIEAWKDAAQTWKDRCLRAEEKLNDVSDAGAAWRELAADYAFQGKPYPPKGTPKRQEFGDRYDKIRERKREARRSGNPELGGLD